MKWGSLFIGLFFLPVLLDANRGQGVEVRRSYKGLLSQKSHLDSLEERFGSRKEVPKAYRAPFLIALSAFPELKDVPIRFQEKDLKTSMAAQPVPHTLFTPSHDREFRILVDTLAPRSEGKLFRELPKEARIGIMAHELGHILDYVKRDLGGMIRYGLRYAFEEERAELEEQTDRTAVDRGFGWQLLAFKEHIHKEAQLSPSYKAYKERVYLSYRDLRGVLQKHPDYSLSAPQL